MSERPHPGPAAGPLADRPATQPADLPALRVAVSDDAPAIDTLMKASTREIFPAFYDEVQTASAVVHIAHVDPMLLEDGTYFVLETGGEIVACGGWSRRDKLFSGEAAQEGLARVLDPATEPARVRAMFVRADWTRRGLGTRILDACEDAARAEGFGGLSLMATLPGVLLYERYGFRRTRDVEITMPDGVRLAAVEMDRAVSRR